MKVLYLLRHAKSSWDSPAMDDFDRPLNKRGLKAAPRVGHYMKENHVIPDLVLCSPAQRTRQTAELTLSAAKQKPEIVFEESIYEAGLPDLLSVVQHQSDHCCKMMMIGHNPGMSQMVESLSGTVDDFPTGALACLELKIDSWKDARQGCGKLTWIVRPREIDD